MKQDLQSDGLGVLRVQLLDTTQADSPSIVLAEVVIRDLVHKLQVGTSLEFSIPLPEGLATSSKLNLRAHLDRDAGGLVKVGDQITMQSYPVTLDQIKKIQNLELKTVE